jgi:uncharacterized protein (TIGR02117 family)
MSIIFARMGPARRVIRSIGRTLLAVLTFVLVYALAVWLLPCVGVNSGYTEPGDGVEVYVRSNGVHTDIVLPLRSPVRDWSRELPFAHTASGDSLFTHVSFGWGDKGFYLETKEWADLKVSTAVKAACGLSGSAMHVTFCERPMLDERCRSVRMTEDVHARLAATIASGFALDKEGRPRWIADRHYARNDAFYEGTGRYCLFFTCNTWANRSLMEAGLPAALWTATPGGIIRRYP